MRRDGCAVGCVEHVGVARVGEHREERLLVRQLAAQRVGHAHGPCGVRVHQRAAVVGPIDDVVDEAPAVDQVDTPAVEGQRRAVKHQVARVAHDSGHSQVEEPRLQHLELGPGRHAAKVHDSNRGRARRPAPLAVAGQERVEHRSHQLRCGGVVPLAEAAGDGQRVEHAHQRLGVAEPGGRLGVVLRKLERTRQDERIQTRCRARALVAGVDRHQRALGLGERKGVEQVRPRGRRGDQRLAHPRDGLRHAASRARPVRRRERRAAGTDSGFGRRNADVATAVRRSTPRRRPASAPPRDAAGRASGRWPR